MNDKDFNHLAKKLAKVQYKVKQLEKTVESLIEPGLPEDEFVQLFFQIEQIENVEDLTEIGNSLPQLGLNKQESMFFSNLVRNKYNLLLIEELDTFIYDLWEKTGHKKKDKRKTFMKRNLEKAKQGNLVDFKTLKDKGDSTRED